VGGLIHAVPETLDLKVELSSASRFPNIDEHFLLGYAPSFPVFGVGSPDLGVETSWGGSTTTGLRLPWFTGEASAYGSFVNDYIYFAPAVGSNGQPSYDVTIRGTWPRYTYSPVDAWVYGADGLASLGPEFAVGLDVGGALVRAMNVETEEHLVGTPSDRMNIDLVGRLPSAGLMKSTEMRLQMQMVAKQGLTDRSADFAAPPDGYTLFGISVQSELNTDPMPLRIGMEVRNLLNTAYRDYTSLLRYYADQPGRDVRVWAAMSF
jgi:iron complex outermembrane receptor protein